jgi:hypothetical protein
MIRHQAKSQEPHVDALACFVKECDKSIVVTFLVEDCTAAVATIEDVVTVAA